MDDFLLLYNRIDILMQEKAKLKKLITELFDICVFEGVGQQTSQYDKVFKIVKEVIKNDG